VWRLQFSDTSKLLDRKIATGFKGTAVSSLTNVNGFEITLEDTREFTTATDNGSMIGWTEDGTVLVDEIGGYDSSALVVYGQSWNAIDWQSITKLRRCYVFTGSPMLAALKVLLSDRGLGSGSGTNHTTYDVLFGITSSSASASRRVEAGQVECRFGAAIPAALIDTDTLTGALLHRQAPGFFYVLGANGEENLLDFLEEVAWFLGGFWYTNADGKISFRLFSASDAYGITATTVNESHLLTSTPAVSVDDESTALHTVSIKCNFDHVANEFAGSVAVINEGTRELYRDTAGTLEIERRGLIVDLPGQSAAQVVGPFATAPQPASMDAIRSTLDRALYRTAYGQRRYTLHLPWGFHQLLPGSRVSVTASFLHDMAGNTLSGTVLDVVRIDIDASPSAMAPVVVQAVDSWASKRVAPTVEIASIAGAVVTLEATSKWHAGSTPARWFAAGWRCKVFDLSVSPPFSASEAVVISSIDSDTQLTLTGSPTLAVDAGDILTLDTYDSDDTHVANAAQSLNQHNYGHQADANELLDKDFSDKWG
jgi:hypothetical protein